MSKPNPIANAPQSEGNRRRVGYFIFQTSTFIDSTSPTDFRNFFNDTATTEIYTLSLHDALPICAFPLDDPANHCARFAQFGERFDVLPGKCFRSEEHTSELQSRRDLVCRLL